MTPDWTYLGQSTVVAFAIVAFCRWVDVRITRWRERKAEEAIRDREAVSLLSRINSDPVRDATTRLSLVRGDRPDEHETGWEDRAG